MNENYYLENKWWVSPYNCIPEVRSTYNLPARVEIHDATLRDGEFHVLGTFIGTLIIVFGFNGLNIFGAPTFSQYVFQGTILVVAVALSSLGRMLAET